jgi:acyl dehydratase
MTDAVPVGMDLGGREIDVAAGDVARYRAGTDTPGAGEDPAPALLYHSEVYRRLDWYLPNIIGNLHARQEWDLFHPFRVGDRLRSRSTVVERYKKRNRDYVVNEVVLTDASGRWLQRSRTHQSFLADEPAPDAIVVDRDRERRSDRRLGPPEGDGERFESPVRTITLAMCEAFSGPSRNYHTDQEMARALGFPDVVVQGMMSVCFVAELMTARFGEGFLAGGKMDVRLVNVVWPGDAIATRGRVREVVGEGGRRRVFCDVWCEKADGTVTVIGGASGVE